MTDKVVDASAFAAAAFLEKEAAAIEGRLAGHQLFAPSLLRYEMANICRRKLSQSPSDRTTILGQFLSSHDVALQLQDVDFVEVVELAGQLNLTAYDASYLWLARSLSAELVTLDEKLDRAAKAI